MQEGAAARAPGMAPVGGVEGKEFMSQARSRVVFRLTAGLLVLAAAAVPGPAPAQAPVAGPAPASEAQELQAKLAAQRKRLEDLEEQIRAAAAPAAEADPKPLDDAAVKKIVENYLKENPGAGVPVGVSTGLEVGKGFYIRSAPNPAWSNWNDQCRIPFELRIHGRIQSDYYFYKVTDKTNHLTGAAGNLTGTPGANDSPDFSQLEIKRGRIFFDGAAFDPNLRFRFDIEANTRGVATTAGGNFPTNTGLSAVAGGAVLPSSAAAVTGFAPGVPGGNQIGTTDHVARLQGAFVAYDFHPCGYEKGCGTDCPEGYYRYTPTVTAFFGKFKPFFGLEETLLPFHEQFVEWSMASWFFDADDDAWTMMAGTQIRAFDDRLYASLMITNGNDSGLSNNLQMDDLPGFNGGFWYDFGGTWNPAQKRWDLFGDAISDIDYSCNPVVRVGGAVNLVPMDRRSEFSNVELNKVRMAPGAPGGTSLLAFLNGGGIANNTAGVGQFAADAFDCYSYDAFIAGKYRGFSLYNDWWFRNVDNFRGRRAPAGAYPGNGLNQPILYSTTLPGGAPTATLFTRGGLFDFGTTLQSGYFVIPKKLEIAGRWSYIRGNSGNIYGDGTSRLLSTAEKAAMGLPTGTAVRVFNNDFKKFQDMDEYAVAVNYFFYRELVKWQTDFSVYTGGNPTAGGQSAAGFIPGVDGWMIRTQIQFGF